MTLGVESVLAPLSGPPPLPGRRGGKLMWVQRPGLRLGWGSVPPREKARLSRGYLSVSAGCEQLPGSKGKGEGSQPGPPRLLVSQTPSSRAASAPGPKPCSLTLSPPPQPLTPQPPPPGELSTHIHQTPLCQPRMQTAAHTHTHSLPASPPLYTVPL